MADRSQPDANNIHSLIAVSTADGISPVTLWADPATHALVTSGGAGAGGTVIIGDGTNIANVLKSDGSAAGQNAELVAGTYLSVPFTTTSIQAVGTTDAGNYRWVSVHTVSQGTTSTITFQGSNDNTNWVNIALQSAASIGTIAPATGTTGASRIDSGPLHFRYFRLNVTGITAGTTAGTIVFSTVPGGELAMGTLSAQSGTWTVGSNSATGSAVPANAFYLGANNGTSLQGINSLPNVLDVVGGSGSLSVGPLLYNGSTWDRARSNESISLLASAARTTTQTSADLVNYNGLSNLDVILDVTVPGTGSITVTINGKDPASGKYYQMLTGAAVTAASTNRYSVGPYIAAVANVRAQDVLPRTFQIVVTANNANSITYSVGYNISRDT